MWALSLLPLEVVPPVGHMSPSTNPGVTACLELWAASLFFPGFCWSHLDRGGCSAQGRGPVLKVTWQCFLSPAHTWRSPEEDGLQQDEGTGQVVPSPSTHLDT
jgi:hypothetical protein